MFENTDSYMRENMLSLNRDKTEIVVFSKNGESKIEQFHYNGIFIEPKSSCRYLGIMIFDIQLNKTLTKIANAIRSIYLVRHFLPLKARIGLFKSLVLSHLNFSAIFFQTLSVMSLQRVNRQINWGIKVCHLRKKFDSKRDLLLKDKILPAEFFIKNVFPLKFFDLLSQYKESSRETKNSSFRIFEMYELTKNSRTLQYFPKNKCHSKWSDRSLIRNFSRRWNTLPIEIRKEKTKNKFKEKLSSKMVKLHED